jgi:nicotinic acid mononucleotide adenylyltransferase
MARFNARNAAIVLMIVLTATVWTMVISTWRTYAKLDQVGDQVVTLRKDVGKDVDARGQLLEEASVADLMADYNTHMAEIRKNVADGMSKLVKDNEDTLKKLNDRIAMLDKAIKDNRTVIDQALAGQ